MVNYFLYFTALLCNYLITAEVTVSSTQHAAHQQVVLRTSVLEVFGHENSKESETALQFSMSQHQSIASRKINKFYIITAESVFIFECFVYDFCCVYLSRSKESHSDDDTIKNILFFCSNKLSNDKVSFSPASFTSQFFQKPSPSENNTNKQQLKIK